MTTTAINMGMTINFTRATITAYAKTLEKFLSDRQVRQAIGEEESYKMGTMCAHLLAHRYNKAVEFANQTKHIRVAANEASGLITIIVSEEFMVAYTEAAFKGMEVILAITHAINALKSMINLSGIKDKIKAIQAMAAEKLEAPKERPAKTTPVKKGQRSTEGHTGPKASAPGLKVKITRKPKAAGADSAE